MNAVCSFFNFQQRRNLKVFISTENNLTHYYQQGLPSFIADKLSFGDWQRADANHLHYRYIVNNAAKAWVVIIQGRAESLIKYAELIGELYQNGFSVFAFDHIGQGQSGRMTENPMHGYVHHFDAYVEDASALLSGVMHKLKIQHHQQALPQFLLAHSMGGAVSTLLLERSPSIFHKAVLCSPMYGIKTPMPAILAKWIVLGGASVHRCLGIRSGYFWGQGDYQAVPFSENKLTGSQTRYKWFSQYYHDNANVSVGGVTFQWLAAALQAMEHIKTHAQVIKTPILGFKAMNDDIVDNRAIDRVFAGFANAELIAVNGAKHELLFEQDSIRIPVLTRILNFFSD